MAGDTQFLISFYKKNKVQLTLAVGKESIH